MSNKNQKAKRQAKIDERKARKAQEETEIKDQSRRNFLKKIVVGGGILAAAGAGLTTYINKAPDKWEFLQGGSRPRYLVNSDGNTSEQIKNIRKECVKLGDIVRIYGDKRSDRDWLKSVEKRIKNKTILKSAKNAGFDTKAQWRVKAYEQIYALPDKPQISKYLIEHCKQCETYLDKNISNLNIPKIDWTVIRKGDDYSGSDISVFNKKSFIGRSLFYLKAADFYNTENPEQTITIEKPFHSDGSLLQTKINPKGELDYWYMLITSGKASLCAAVSETLPLVTYPTVFRYAQEAGKEAALMADETLVEGIRHVIAEQMIKDFKIPNGNKILEATIENMLQSSSMYKSVPQSIDWIKKNSVKDAFDLYMEDPGKFIKSING